MTVEPSSDEFGDAKGMDTFTRQGEVLDLVSAIYYLRAVDLCEAYHAPVSSHLFVEVSGHVVAAASHATLLEHMDWWQELFDDRLALVDGHVVLPDRPGIGVGLDRKALARFRA